MATAVIGTQTADMHTSGLAGELALPRAARLGEKGLGLFREGLAEGVPIALGYFAVSFSLGIAAKMSGLSLSQGVVTSFLCNASAGEYAGFTMVAANASYLELAVMMLIANARYLLMGCVLSQRFSPDTPLWMRALIAFDNTDEIFAVNVAHRGDVRPARALGLMALPLVGWAGGTAVGMLVGGVLPKLVVQALSVSLFGMFLAVIVPPARQNRVVAGVVAVSSSSTSWPRSPRSSRPWARACAPSCSRWPSPVRRPCCSRTRRGTRKRGRRSMGSMGWGYVAVMAGVTFATRALPATLIRRRVTNRFLRSFLYYVPYVTLAVMTFPAILGATGVPAAGAVALLVGIVLAWRGAGLFVVSGACCASVLAVTLLAQAL